MKTFKEWITENYDQDELKEIAQHGCASCCPGGLIYYHETAKAYEAYSEEIWASMGDIMDSLGCSTVLELLASFNGAKQVNNDSTFKNMMVWAYVEEIARNATEEQNE
jgi:hypothetical protein